MNRLREAREYMGLSESEVAGFLHTRIYALRMMELSGALAPSEWERLSILYRRPIAWLQGAPAEPVDIPADLAQLMEDKQLSDHDRSEVVAFVEFLRQGKA